MICYFLLFHNLLFGEGNGTPLQYSCLENPMDGGAWEAAVHGVAESWTQLSDFTFTFHFSLSCIREGNGNPLQCSCLENPRGGGAWWAAVYGVTQRWTWLKWLTSSSSSSSSNLLFFFMDIISPFIFMRISSIVISIKKMFLSVSLGISRSLLQV